MFLFLALRRLCRVDDGRWRVGKAEQTKNNKTELLLRNDHQIGTAGRLNPKDLIRSLRELDNKWCGHGAEWMLVRQDESEREREKTYNTQQHNTKKGWIDVRACVCVCWLSF